MSPLPRAVTIALPPALLAALFLGCGEPCPTGQTRCDGVCVDTLVTATHCGACGQGCGLGTCAAGACTCDTGSTDCPGIWPQCVDVATSDAACGSCNVACVTSTGADCVAGSCACSGTLTNKCGTTEVSCCEVAGCCGEACQTKHANGLGNFFFDCNPLDTHTRDTAAVAATAWSAAFVTNYPALQCGDGLCYARQTSMDCAVWCYSGTFTGTVTLNDIDTFCPCPPQGNVVTSWH